jgi:hypothetical protein
MKEAENNTYLEQCLHHFKTQCQAVSRATVDTPATPVHLNVKHLREQLHKQCMKQITLRFPEEEIRKLLSTKSTTAKCSMRNLPVHSIK